ncbi:MAG TPA: 3-oxoacyl-ACP synthase [Micromonosporaceae bacterium]
MAGPVPAYLSGASYVLGEVAVHHADLPGFAERARALRMPMVANLFGWGTVRRTDRDLVELAVESGRATLGAAGVAPDQVGALILCSTRFPGGPDTHGQFVASIMAGLDLTEAAFTGLTLNRCTNLLAGIDIAAALVGCGRHRDVLVITTDAIDDESARLEQFALFSDGAASCLVAAQPYGSPAFEVLSCASAQRNADLDWSHEISAELSRTVNEALLKADGRGLDGVTALLHANLFLPIVTMKERQAGFTADQLDTGNVARTGHCFAADPLINLVDRVSAGRVSDGDTYMLAVSVPGVRHGILLRAGR